MTLDEFLSSALENGYEEVIPEYLRIIPDNLLLGTSDIAKYLGVSEETVRRWCRKNEIDHTSVGRYKVYGRALKEFLYMKNRHRLRKRFPELFK